MKVYTIEEKEVINQERKLKRLTSFYWKLRQKTIKLLGGKCANPFNIDHSGFEKSEYYIYFLQIDHINGGGKKRIS